jgi:hypothetical protein
VAAGVVALLLGTALTRAWRNPLRFALELWMAAGLLRLRGDVAWAVIAAAAALVAIRQVVGRALLSQR